LHKKLSEAGDWAGISVAAAKYWYSLPQSTKLSWQKLAELSKYQSIDYLAQKLEQRHRRRA
ncbi:hypothetical protein SJAG_06638, partial [Schizosaccharomyces japonicus yFS275]